MDFNEISGAAEGWLEIIKVTNGEEEIVFSDKNVVCSGMGVTLSFNVLCYRCRRL